jgi:probable regulatory protein lysR family
MNLDWYYTFLVLSKHLNYRKASEELFLTEPTLHQQIKKLEKHLQVQLFETVGRNLTLTAVGREFIEIAKNLIQTYEQSIQKIRLQNKKQQSHIKIAVSPYIATYLLPQFLQEFFQRYPDIDISVSVLNSHIEQAIETNTFDIGIDREVPYSKKIISEQICEGKIALFYPKTIVKCDELQLFKNYKILSDNHPVYWENLKKEIIELVPEADFTAINDITVTAKLIEMNQGISFLPLYLKKTFKDKIAHLEATTVTTPVSFTYLMSRKTSKAITIFNNAFKDFILKEQNSI